MVIDPARPDVTGEDPDAVFGDSALRPVPRGWALPFVAVALVGQILAAVPGPPSLATFIASTLVLVVVIGLALVLTGRRAPVWAHMLAPSGYVISLGLLFMSRDPAAMELRPLILLPIVWVALYHRAGQSVAIVAAAAGTIAVTSWLNHRSFLAATGLWALIGLLVVHGAYNLRRRLGGALADREEALRQAEILSNVAHELNSTLDPDRVVAVGVRLAAEIASPPGLRARRANYCRIIDGEVRVDVEFDGEGEWVGAAWPLAEHPLLAEVVRCRVPLSGALDPAQLGPAVRRLAQAQGVGHGGWVPVIVNGELHGVLAVAGRNRPVSDRELSSCVAIVRIMELALRNALALQQSERAALTDPLTSLANRRGLKRVVNERRGRLELAVLAVDVDRLKEVNDHLGHAAGDEVLQLVAKAISTDLRAGEVVARIGGDEFACVLFDSDEEAGASVASRMLEAVLEACPDGRPPGISIGVASVAPEGSLLDGLRRADAAMYAAKRAGGMRYELASIWPSPDHRDREAA